MEAIARRPLATMARRSWLAGVLLLALALSARADDEETEAVFADGDEPGFPGAAIPSAHLIVDKTIVEEKLVEGKDFTVQIKIYNVGDLPATDIELTDGKWSEMMATSPGGGTATIPSLAPNANFTHTYKTSVGPVAQLASNAAEVKYRATPNADELQTSMSPPIYGVAVLTKSQNFRSVAVNVGSYISLGLLKTETQWQGGLAVAIIIGGALGVNDAILKTRAAVKSRNSRRVRASQKALRELQNLE